ncbi:MAG TPA: TIGR03435 family protein [Terriglobia bacterium]|jgi:uncharacterized protein (TIGR03435 family)
MPKRISIVVCLLLSGTVHGVQVNAVPAFEVASVKPSLPSGRGAPRQVGGCRGSDTPAGNGSRIENIPLGRCVFRVARLSEILGDMYKLSNDRISGLPDWDRSSFFDVEGKAEDPERTTEAQLIQMLQRLLTERFRLDMRHVTVEAPVFAMRAGRKGHKLQVSKEESASVTPQGGSLVFKGMTMAKLADFLSGMPAVGRPVADATELRGRFDFTLTVLDTKPENAGDLKGAMSRWDSVLSDVEEQLGLRFDSEKRMVDGLIIDHAEKPMAN